MPSIGPLELIIILVIVLLIFGPKRLPGLGRQLGSGMREFKDGITGKDKDDADEGSDAAARAFGDEPTERAQVEPPPAPVVIPEPPVVPEQAPAAVGEPDGPDVPRSEG